MKFLTIVVLFVGVDQIISQLSSSSEQSEDCLITLEPSNITNVVAGIFTYVNVSCSCCKQSILYKTLIRSLKEKGEVSFPDNETGIFMLQIATKNKHVATPSKHSRRRRGVRHPNCVHGKLCINMQYIYPFTSPYFYVEANQVGRTVIEVSLHWANITQKELRKKEPSESIESDRMLNLTELPVSVVRRYRIFYPGFDYSAVVIACLIALSVGCCTEFSHIKKHVRSPVGVVAALVGQHFLMPTLAIGIKHITKLSSDFGFGLFTTALVSGGGLAHLIVFLIDGDQPISAVISTFNCILNMCIAPCWLLAMKPHFNIYIDFTQFLMWLLPVLVSQLCGVLIRQIRPAAADAVMNWFTRPLLLLAGILLITLGVYINQYAFEYAFSKHDLMLSVALLIFGGFIIGGLLGFITRQDKVAVKSLAAETSVFNCLIVIPVLRNALRQPDADLASTVPLWGFFFTPAPILIYFVMNRAKKWVSNFIEKRKEKQYRHYSIVSSLAKMTEEVTAVSAPLVMDEQPSDSTSKVPSMKEERTTAL